MPEYEIVHDHGDRAEAETMSDARVAARTLCTDNRGGTCRIRHGFGEVATYTFVAPDTWLITDGGWWQ